MMESTRPIYNISFLFPFLAIFLFKSISTAGGNVSQFEKATSGIADARLTSNSTNNNMQMSPVLDVTSAAKSSMIRTHVMNEQLSALPQMSQLPKPLIRNNFSQSAFLQKLKKSALGSNIDKDKLIKQHSENSSEIFSTFEKNKKLDLNLQEMQIKNETILPCATPTSDSSKESKNICIEEDCVIAAATILSSLDRTVNPCENFYDFACGGWMKKALELSTDRFQMIDKRNQKLLESILEKVEATDDNDSNNIRAINTANGKASAFYKSCVRDSEGQEKDNLHDLITVILNAGGVSFGTLRDDTWNDKMSFNERVRTMHTDFGLNVLFTWGVVDVEGEHRVAIINGGFNEELTEDTFDKPEYLKIMARIINLLSEAQDDSIIIGLDYDDEMTVPLNDTEVNNSTTLMNITYEYEELADDYNSPYDYNEASGNKDRSTLQNIGDTLLDLFKKPIEWISPSSIPDKTFPRKKALGSLEHSRTIPLTMLNNSRTKTHNTLSYNYNTEEDRLNSLKDDNERNMSSESHKNTAQDKDHSTEQSGASIRTDEHEQSLDGGPIIFDSNEQSLENQLHTILEVRKQIELELTKVIEFEEKLARISPQRLEMLRPDMLTPYSIDSLSNEFPFLNWREFFDSSLQSAVDEGNGEKKMFSNDTEVLVQKEFLQGVNELVLQYRNLSTEHSVEEGNDILTNYMIWRLIAAFYPDRPIDEAERKSKCLKDTEDMFAPAVTAMFVESKGRNKSKHLVQEVDEMVNTMKAAFKENLPRLEWMSNGSLAAAETKLDQMVDLIGYPEFVMNSSWVDSIYADLSITEDSYLMNTVAHRAFSRKLEIKEYFSPQDNGNWKGFSLDFSSNIATVNAYYNPTSNTMVVPIGMLQPPLFWSRPKSLTFGAFGIVVAHEITHAFDDVGIQYDSTGSYRALYDNETVSKFHEASDCVRRQYSNYTIGNRDGDPSKFFRVDGNITLGENIADHGGLKIAEIAYEKWLTTQPNGERDVVLPALENFSDEQLFYLGYALPWCAVHTETLMRNHVIKDEHAPDRFRVIGPLSNSEKFARAWSCPNDGSSKMNPKGKCKVW